MKHLAELHGGSVRVKSGGEERGAPRLSWRLPISVLRQAEEEVARAERPNLRRGRRRLGRAARVSQGVTALVVDDEPDARVLVNRLIEGARWPRTHGELRRRGAEAACG